MRQARLVSFASLLAVTGLVFFGALSCSTTEKREQQRSQAWIDRVALATLHYRRPEGASADPNVGPGGEDYQSHPLPNSKFDCEPAEKLFAGLDLTAIRQCLLSAKSATRDFILTFSVQKSTQPKLILHKEGLAKTDQAQDGQIQSGQLRPSCMDSLLAEIPMPREIFYQGVRDTKPDELGCFASGVTPDTAPLLGIDLRPQHLDVALRLSSIRDLKTDADVRHLLLTWVIQPFWNTERNQLPAKVVPDRLCRVCIGEKNIVRVSVPPVPLWPTREDQLKTDDSLFLEESSLQDPDANPDLPK